MRTRQAIMFRLRGVVYVCFQDKTEIIIFSDKAIKRPKFTKDCLTHMQTFNKKSAQINQNNKINNRDNYKSNNNRKEDAE